MADHVEDDPSLMLRVKRGDTEAFATLVDRYKQPVLNVISRMLQDPAEAEDVAQNVFLQVYRSAGRYEAKAKFSTWLFTIVRNLCLNELRRRSRHAAESMDAARPEQEDQPAHQYVDHRTGEPPEELLRSELAHKVEQAIAELPDNQRLALLLCKEDELSYEDMAQAMGCSVSATKSLIHRGRETLRAKLKEYLRSGLWNDPPGPNPVGAKK